MGNDELKGKTLLLVNTGPSKKKFIIKKLKKLGLSLVVLNREKNWADPYVDHWIIADTYNHNESLLAVQAFTRNHPHLSLNGALTFWEDDVLLTSKIVDTFGLTGIHHNIARQVRNKYAFREFCERNGIHSPRHAIIKDSAGVKNILKNFHFPLVIKPAFGSSSAYVVKVESEKELIHSFNYIKKNMSTDAESALSDGFDIFVEEYIEGDEVDVDILIQNGKIKFSSVADNFNKNRGQFFVDSGQAIPSRLPANSQAGLVKMAEETLEKLGIQNACIHFEAKATPYGPIPIEVNMRMGGDYVYSYVKGCWGIDLVENAAKIALGIDIKIDRPDNPYKYIIGWDLQPPHSGILAALEIDAELKNKPYLEETHFFKNVGDIILRPPQGYDSLGWLTVSGASYAEAHKNLQEALQLIRYSVMELPNEPKERIIAEAECSTNARPV